MREERWTFSLKFLTGLKIQYNTIQYCTAQKIGRLEWKKKVKNEGDRRGRFGRPDAMYADLAVPAAG
jgi:hypothetical protein